MSDFFSSGWSIYIAVATVLGLAACLALLIIASKTQVASADGSTGHVWDEDLIELNNPLPRWWMWLFVITIVFGAVYLVLYPGLGSFKGTGLRKMIPQTSITQCAGIILDDMEHPEHKSGA